MTAVRPSLGLRFWLIAAAAVAGMLITASMGRWQLSRAAEKEALQILEEVAKLRGCLIKGGELDYGKASRLLMDDFRSGKLGRITLEMPEEA